MGELRLEVREFQDLTRWRWVLTGAGGTLLADHEVRLDAGCWQHEAFGDLLSYLAGDVIDIATGYHNLGSYLYRHARQPVAAAAHHLASAVIRALSDADGADEAALEAAGDLRAGAGVGLPADVADLCRRVAGIPGTDLDRLISALAPDPGTAERALRELTAHVRDLASASPATDRSHLAAWDPVLAAVLAADGGDIQAAAALDAELDRVQDSPTRARWRPRCGGCARAAPARTCSPGSKRSTPRS